MTLLKSTGCLKYLACVVMGPVLLVSCQLQRVYATTCAGGCASTWEKCAGSAFDGLMKPCCNQEDHCVQKNNYYSQCRPKSDENPLEWSPGRVLTCGSPSSKCTSVGCAGTFSKCAGTHMSGVVACCESDDHCVQKNMYYAQCLPKADPLPEAWSDAKVLPCST